MRHTRKKNVIRKTFGFLWFRSDALQTLLHKACFVFLFNCFARVTFKNDSRNWDGVRRPLRCHCDWIPIVIYYFAIFHLQNYTSSISLCCVRLFVEWCALSISRNNSQRLDDYLFFPLKWLLLCIRRSISLSLSSMLTSRVDASNKVQWFLAPQICHTELNVFQMLWGNKITCWRYMALSNTLCV